MADRIPHAQFVALDSDIDLICVSDVIDDAAQHIGKFIEQRVHSSETTPQVEGAGCV